MNHAHFLSAMFGVATPKKISAVVGHSSVAIPFTQLPTGNPGNLTNRKPEPHTETYNWTGMRSARDALEPAPSTRLAASSSCGLHMAPTCPPRTEIFKPTPFVPTPGKKGEERKTLVARPIPVFARAHTAVLVHKSPGNPFLFARMRRREDEGRQGRKRGREEEDNGSDEDAHARPFREVHLPLKAC